MLYNVKAMLCLGNNHKASLSHVITSDGLFIHCKLICLQQQNLVDIYYDGILGLGQNGPETYQASSLKGLSICIYRAGSQQLQQVHIAFGHKMSL